jgi:hypothetical protein
VCVVLSKCVVVSRYLSYIAIPMYTKTKFTFIQSTNYEFDLKYLTDLHKIYTKKDLLTMESNTLLATLRLHF